MSQMTARIFRNGRNQAIRIPVELSFDTKTVTLEKRGEALIIRPKRERGWDRYFNDPAMVLPADFETGDDPPAPERSLF